MTIELTDCKVRRLAKWLNDYAAFKRVCAGALERVFEDDPSSGQTALKMARADKKLAAEIEHFVCAHLAQGKKSGGGK